MNELTDRVFAFAWVFRIAVEVLAHDDVGRQLAPTRGDFRIVLFEENFAVLVLDRSAADFPCDGIEGICDGCRAEFGFDFKSVTIATNFPRRSGPGATLTSHFYCCHSFVRLPNFRGEKPQ